MVKAALLGVTHGHSRGHLRTLQALREIEGIYLWDENPEALAKMQQESGDKIIGTSTNLEELLKNKDIFFVISALRNDNGPDICLRALAAGKHILAEKPIGRTAADVERVVVAAERAGLQLGVAYTNRTNPVALKARELVQQGIIGPLVSMESRIITTQVAARNPKSWFFDQAVAGGGILAWLGCHYLDMFRFVSGDEVKSVSAEVATMSGEDITVEDVASVSLRFRSGAIASLHAGYLLPLSGPKYSNPPANETYYGFRGRGGRVYWDPVARPAVLKVESTRPDWSAAPMSEFIYQLRESQAYGGGYGEDFVLEFIRAGQGQGAPPASGRDALAVSRIIDAAYESSRTGRRIELAG
ncbi:MAG: Gfo/Idh/MocA family oxidoreductase [Chloroflexi bacterium]|nr:Gfo/Idh/MocA family oxidoreductase [Chloroflexota bacterium]